MSGENLDIAAIMVSPLFMLGGGVIGYEIGGNIGCLMLMTAYPTLLVLFVALDFYRHGAPADERHPDIVVPVIIGTVPTFMIAALGYSICGVVGAAAGACVVPIMFVVMMVVDEVLRRYVPDDAEGEP